MKKKSINNIKLITLGLILVLAFININIFNQLNDYLDKKNQYLRENLELSDYSSFIEGEGEDINITSINITGRNSFIGNYKCL